MTFKQSFPLLTLTVVLLAAPATSHAQNNLNSLSDSFDKVQQEAQNLGIKTPASNQKPQDFIIASIQTAIEVALSFVGILALALIIYGGFVYMTAAGNESRAQTGKKIILGTVIGLIIIGLAAVIVIFVMSLFS